jgi:glyoxylase-like metal-dependent hydrolase (beta-lactamase superfamily II)
MRRFREVAPGVLMATSDLLVSTTTVVTSDDGGCLVIDPAVSVADLAALAGDLRGAGLTPRAGFATHPHWDHVLWSRELGDVPRWAAPAGLSIVATELDGMLPHLDRTAPGHDMGLFGRLTALPQDAERIPWDGPEARLVIHDGHAPGHGGVFLPGPGVLVAGDMLSDIEIPLLDTVADDPLGDYRDGLERLGSLDGVRWVIPGHGSIGDAAEYRRRVAADLVYLDRLERGEPFEDPRITLDWLRDSHADQLAKVGGVARGG